MGKKIQTVETKSLIAYKINPTAIDIAKKKFFFIFVLVEIIFGSVFLNNSLSFLVWGILIGLTIPIVILILIIRNAMKIELNQNTRELRYSDKNGRSEWKVIPTNGKIMYTINTEDVTYYYPNNQLVDRVLQYVANLEIQDDMGNIKFHLSSLSRKKRDVHWVGQMARNLAEKLNLETGGVNEVIVRRELSPYKGGLYSWLVRDRSRSNWD